MTVEKLIALLSYMNPNAEVRLAIQHRWSFEHELGNVAMTEDEQTVYIGEGTQIGYLPGEAAEALMW